MLNGKNEGSGVTKVEVITDDKLIYETDKSPIQIYEISNPNGAQIKFDKYSKKLLFIYKDKVEVYNKSKSKIKKEFNIALRSDSKYQISKIAISKMLTNILIISENAFGQKNFELVELQTSNRNKITKDLKYLMDLMFITENLFAMIWPTSIVFYYIDLDKKVIKSMKKFDYGKKLIQDFKYNSDFQVLIVLKIDLTFDIINLSDIKYLSFPPKTFNPNFMTKSCDLFLSSLNSGGFFSIFSKDMKKIEKAEGIICSNYKNPEYYNRRSQFYLETMYFSLYFIYFNLEKEKIYIIKITNINEFITDYSKDLLVLDFPKNYGCSSMQFIDNMILVHNFKMSQIFVYDIKLKKTFSDGKLLCICKTNFYDENTISKDKIRGNLIIKKETKFYKVHFLAQNYYNFFPIVDFKDFAIINIMIRKKAQYLLLEILKQKLLDYCIKPEKIIKILEIMEYVAEKINDSLQFVEKYANQKSTLDIVPIQRKVLEIAAYPEIGKKLNKRIITINQVVDAIFIPIGEENFTAEEEIKTGMKILFISYSYFEKKGIQIPRIFSNAVLGLIKKVKDINLIKNFIQCYYKILATINVAEYLIKTEYIKDLFIKNNVIYILEERRHFERAFEIILQIDGIKCAIEFIKPFIKIANKEKLKKILLSNQDFIPKWKEQIKSYLSSSEE